MTKPLTPERDLAMNLLNSLGIVGPNIIHAEQGMHPDGKHSYDNTWDGPGWCVCRREWPCEAQQLGEVVATLGLRAEGLETAAREHVEAECRCRGGGTHDFDCALVTTESALRAALQAMKENDGR